MSAAGNGSAVIGQAAEMARSRGGQADRGAAAEELDAALQWLDTAETRSAIDLVPLAVLAEILTLLFAADARKP